MAPRTISKSAFLLLVVGAATLAGSQKPGSDKDNDKFGVKMLYSTIKGGREWHADWEQKRSVAAYKVDPLDPLFRNSEGKLEIGGGIAMAPAGQTRFFIMTPKDEAEKYLAELWKNVEMTAYVKCGAPTQSVNGQALVLSARSGERHHHTVPCDGTSYHGTLRFDSKCGFKKEIWHKGGYTDLQPTPAPKPWSHVPQGEWIGMKFICRNCNGDKHVQFQFYLDLHERNDWKLISEYTDQGG